MTKSIVSYLLAVLFCGSCGQVQSAALSHRPVRIFLNRLKASLKARPQWGIVRSGSAEWYPLSASEVSGITKCFSSQGVMISDINVNKGLVHTYSLRQIHKQIQHRQGEVFDQLDHTNSFYRDEDPKVTEVHYKVVRGNLIVTMYDSFERLTFKSERGNLKLQRMDNLQVWGSGT